MATVCQTLERHRFFAGTARPIALIAGFFFAVRALIPFAATQLLGTAPEAGAVLRLSLGFIVLGLASLELLQPAYIKSGELLRMPPVRWMLVYLGLAAASFGWGTMASPTASFAYLCGTASDLAILLLLVRAMPADEIATALMKSFVWGACLIAIAGWIMPAESDLRLGNQDYFNANTIGNICAFGIYFAQYLIRRTHARLTLPAIFLALTLLRSLSKTTIAAFALSQAIFLIQDRAMSRKTKFWLTVGAACCVFFFWGLFEAYYDLYTTSGNQAETLTGRTAIWLYVVDAALQAPWVGHGFDSMWKIVPAFGTFEARHAENELLQQVYAFGATGAVLLCGIYASLYKTIRRIPFAAWRLPLSCLLLFALVRGLAEADPFDLLMPLWCVALIAAIASEAALEPRSADIGPIHFRPKTVSHGLT